MTLSNGDMAFESFTSADHRIQPVLPSSLLAAGLMVQNGQRSAPTAAPSMRLQSTHPFSLLGLTRTDDEFEAALLLAEQR